MYTETFQAITDTLKKRINPVFIIVFGSYAKNNTHPGSDIDVAFYCEDDTLPAYEVFQIAQELADILKIETDLVNIRRASTVFQAQIYSTGTVIYSSNSTLLKNLEMTAFSMYAKLNEERQMIMNNIVERGTIYEK